jgi:hypothetical protein
MYHGLVELFFILGSDMDQKTAATIQILSNPPTHNVNVVDIIDYLTARQAKCCNSYATMLQLCLSHNRCFSHYSDVDIALLSFVSHVFIPVDIPTWSSRSVLPSTCECKKQD